MGQLSQPDPKDPSKPFYQNNTWKAGWDQREQWFEYRYFHKAPTDPLLQAIVPIAAFVDVQGASPWTRIGRGKFIFEFIQNHLPDPTADTPFNMWIKVVQIKDLLNKHVARLRFITDGAIRQPDGSIKPIGEFDPYSLQQGVGPIGGPGEGPGQGGGPGNFNPDPSTVFPDATPNAEPDQPEPPQ